MFVALLRPSRGTVFDESEQACVDNLKHCEWVRLSNKKPLPIPDAFNVLVRRFLKETPALYAWIVEEDTVPPIAALSRMIGLGADIAAIDYPLKLDGRRSIGMWPDGRHWVSTGCMLVHRHVFEQLADPWFRTDKAIAWSYDGSHDGNKYLRLIDAPRTDYGGQDAYFCFVAQEAGFRIASVPDARCRHLRVRRFGKADTNTGAHIIEDVEPRKGFPEYEQLTIGSR